MILFTHAEITNSASTSPWKTLTGRGLWKAALEQASADPTGEYLINKRSSYRGARPYAIETSGTPYALTQSTPEVAFWSAAEDAQVVRNASGTPAVDTDVRFVLVDPTE